jgi:hypothetical protein
LQLKAALTQLQARFQRQLDYCKFLTMLLNKGSYNGKVVLSEKSVATLLSLQTETAIVVFNPKGVEHSGHAFGSWVDDKVFYAPGFQGSFAFLDTCRNYAGTIIVKSNPKEETIRLLQAGGRSIEANWWRMQIRVVGGWME